MPTRHIGVVLMVATTCIFAQTTKLQKHFEWNILDFQYPDARTKFNSLVTGKLKPENALPVGIEVWKDKVFVTVPRWREGIPATLNYVHLLSPLSSPPLIPYPSLEANELGNCENGLNTVYRIHADECDRLWVLDTGTFGIEDTTQNPCPYSLNIFDLNTDKRIHKYELRKEDINAQTFIANIAVEVGKTCNEAHAYFSDELGYGLIVYSLEENRSWRFEHSFFLPDPLRGDFVIDNMNFQWGTEGIFGLSLTPTLPDGFRNLYFSPLASNREFAVSTRILHNSSLTEDSYHEFYFSSNERGPDTHTTSRVINDGEVQFFNLIDQNAIGCWNYKTPYSESNIAVLEKNHAELIFPADIKVDRNKYLWVISDRMPKFLLSSLDYSEPNFRIFFAHVEDLVRGTVCESSTQFEDDSEDFYRSLYWDSSSLMKEIYYPARKLGSNDLLENTEFIKA
ncbi:protein yellow-like [Euwallacea fornicatus]|uniref:protein yellow-like n=1 Tax=Euwallacea fornicatus TaxID=995702 RepID=UPI00338FEC27